MKHGYARISKASPIVCIGNFLNQYYPNCDKKYTHFDQGGEIFNNPDVKSLLQPFGYNIHPTVANTSNQHGTVKKYHRTLANYIQDKLTGSNLDIIFFPYALYHAIQLYNPFP